MNNRILERSVLQVIYWLMVLAFAFPIFWFILTSFKTRVDAFSFPPKILFTPTLDNFQSVLGNASFIHNYMNSIIIGVSTTLLSLLFGLPAAYALARFHMKKKENLAFWILSIRMAPPIMVILPFYLIFQRLDLLDTYIGLILVYLTISLPFVVWMMRGYFESIPVDLDNAARIDGASRLKAFLMVVIPLASPGIVASAIFSFITAWNEFIFALILTGNQTKTTTIAVTGFISLEGIRWGEVAAAGTLVCLPVILFGLVIQKYLVSGLTMGSVK
ncbi:carbohydrate ABC transporter permease [Paenibacillus senegalensis]|uniref:carbohydrate ABC transporter permease n=1 Tax=Paenibacillus senegalensis TaxID=1465766 RepID=UPI000288F933|nr:carbohydrate ABC transporter permease [Paenibacillus senegalensis]